MRLCMTFAYVTCVTLSKLNRGVNSYLLSPPLSFDNVPHGTRANVIHNDFGIQLDIQLMLWMAFRRQPKYFHYQVIFISSYDFVKSKTFQAVSTQNIQLGYHIIMYLGVLTTYNVIYRTKLCYIHIFRMCTNCI